MIDTRSECSEEICKESRVFLQVKVESSVVNLKIGDFDNDLLEGIMFLTSAKSLKKDYPCIHRVLHHGEDSIVEFVVVNIEHNLFCMQGGFFARTDDFGNVDPGPKEFEMLHSLLWLVFRV
jgi:hypothetical protein